MHGRSLLGDAIALVERLRTYAADVQYARIGLTGAKDIVDSDSSNDDGWLRARGAWDQYIRLAYPIQVLTAAHLRRCTDLSGWDVEKVAADRWLVTDKDLDRWFNQPFEGLALTARGLTQLSRNAEAGFGDAIFPHRFLVSPPGVTRLEVTPAAVSRQFR